MGLDIFFNVRTSDLFFALNEELDVYRQSAVFVEIFEQCQTHDEFALVVASSANDESFVFNRRFERIRIPLFDGFRRLNVIMIVKQNRFFAFSGKFSKDDRIGAFFPPLFNLFGTKFFKCLI